jgi:hypothetical protein
MYYIHLIKPLPGIRSTIFIFHNQLEAEEFASSIHSKYPDAETEEGIVGEATEVFESWSF